jgi:hypothetical protein
VLLVLVFSLHLLNETFARKRSFKRILKIQDPVCLKKKKITCGFPYFYPTFRSKQTRSSRSFQSQEKTNTIKSKEYPHFHNAHARGPSPGRRLERQSAKAESCIRNFLLQTVPLLSRFHGWRAASSRALNLVVRPQRPVTGPPTEPKKRRRKKRSSVRGPAALGTWECLAPLPRPPGRARRSPAARSRSTRGSRGARAPTLRGDGPQERGHDRSPHPKPPSRPRLTRWFKNAPLGLHTSPQGSGAQRREPSGAPGRLCRAPAAPIPPSNVAHRGPGASEPPTQRRRPSARRASAGPGVPGRGRPARRQ